jgi:hypothetical protein
VDTMSVLYLLGFLAVCLAGTAALMGGGER